jgi:hypothetical protein
LLLCETALDVVDNAHKIYFVILVAVSLPSLVVSVLHIQGKRHTEESSVPEGCIACDKSVELSALSERYFEFLRNEWTGDGMPVCSVPLSPRIYRNAL